jgi:hypothetical protein
VPSLPTQQFNVMKDYEAWERNQDYHFLRVGNGSASALESSATRLTAGEWVIGVSNTADTVLSSVLSSRCVCASANTGIILLGSKSVGLFRYTSCCTKGGHPARERRTQQRRSTCPHTQS